MRLLKTIMAATLSVGLFACSSDEPGNGVIDHPQTRDGIYSSISFRFPTVRSEQSEGVEVGQNYENNVGSILVVMADKNEAGEYTFISYALNDAPITNATNNTYTVTFQDKEALFERAGNTVYIFAYCNPTEALRAKVAGNMNPETGNYEGGLSGGGTFTEEIFSGDVYSTWEKNGFLMSSVEVVEKELPSQEELKTYNSAGNPMQLGTVTVQRTMSRFDFRDAADNDTPLTYAIKHPENKDEVQGSVKFTRVALFNLADRFYYLPRTKADAASDIKLCPGTAGMEQGYVISADGRNYTETLPERIDPLNPTTDLKWASLEAILGLDEDIDEGWGENVDPAGDKLGYHIWRYATENTFGPGVANGTGNTTGYVFEAEIQVPEDFGNVGADGQKQVMYLYRDILYPNAMAIAKAVAEVPVSTLATAFENAFDITRDADGKVINAVPKSDTVVENMGFTAYKPNAEGKYLCYYFAFNKHNDNGDPTSVGPMEYASVRNNVYKLAVTTVKKFGTFTPTTDVEEWDTYFTLDVKVLPWVVRINNIEF